MKFVRSRPSPSRSFMVGLGSEPEFTLHSTKVRCWETATNLQSRFLRSANLDA